MTDTGYGQFCPVAMASELLCTRWTMLVVRELVCGSKRFNDLRRGVPRMSPALLSKRLKEMEKFGLIRRVVVRDGDGGFEYHLTPAGRELQAIVEAIGFWGQKWVDARVSLQRLDPSLLMWDMRRRIDPDRIPERHCVIQFLYRDLPAKSRRYWLVVTPERAVDLCLIDPGFDVDLYVTTDLRTMTATWMGLMSLTQAQEDGSLELTGDKRLADSMPHWLNLSLFAGQKKLATA